MTDDFDVITGPPAAPPKIKPAAPPVPEPRRSADRDKIAAIPKAPASAK